MACVWFLDEERLCAFAVAAGLAVLCQEQIGLIVACLGVAYGWRTRRWGPAVTIVGLGLAVTAVDLRVVLPHFSDGSPCGSSLHRRRWFRGRCREHFCAAPVASHRSRRRACPPTRTCALVGARARAVFRSAVMLAAVPQLGIRASVGAGDGYGANVQNILPIVPFVFTGAVYALARSKGGKWQAGHVLVASIACAVFFGPLNPKLFPSVSVRHAAAERRAVSLVPAGAPVSATNHLGAHLADRSYLGIFPVVGKATWLMVDMTDAYLPDRRWLRRRGTAVGVTDLVWRPKQMKSELWQLEESPRWKRVYSSDGVMVFTRSAARTR